jgi:hypothetical protein
MRRLVWIAAILLAASAICEDAAAVIGRPLTPGSYRGVARRTVRRVGVVATAPVTTEDAAHVPRRQ